MLKELHHARGHDLIEQSRPPPTSLTADDNARPTGGARLPIVRFPRRSPDRTL